MVITNLLNLAVGELDHFGADRFSLLANLEGEHFSRMHTNFRGHPLYH
jgi:hypothetical protein